MALYKNFSRKPSGPADFAFFNEKIPISTSLIPKVQLVNKEKMELVGSEFDDGETVLNYDEKKSEIDSELILSSQ